MCIAAPVPQLPALPSPLSATLPKLGISLAASLCCKTKSFEKSLPVPPLPPETFTPAAAALLKKFNAQIRDWVNAQPLRCPRDP